MSEERQLVFNPPPGWPRPPRGWTPPKGWTPDPSWPAPPPGWQLWADVNAADRPDSADAQDAARRSSLSADNRSPNDTQATLKHRIALLEAENAALRTQIETAGFKPSEVIALDDERILQDVGVYRYHHPLENALAYKDRLEAIASGIAELVKAGEAIEISSSFTFNGSLANGRRMTTDMAKLMLRAYNAEAENVVRSLRAGNIVTATKRLVGSREAIANLGKMMEMRIGDAYHALRIQEIELAADYLMKKEEEREAAREERERLREERKVELELLAERERLNKERSHIATVLEKLRTSGSTDEQLERKLADVDQAIAKNDFRAANIRAGYIYVISNRGAFGDRVVKIGLTRRLEPMDRIHELGDASVPFRFDVHALYFSEDAVGLENELHQHFEKLRVNWPNMRREFFFATPAEVRKVLTEKLGNLLEFTEHVESTEYLQSVKYWPEYVRGVGATLITTASP